MNEGPIVALAGNPNAGKTSLFNALTSSRQHVGNWPGKTVEKRSGRHSGAGGSFQVVDLPGTYSLSASSPEELVARDYLTGGEVDAVAIVIDGSNIERNLYLAVQILEIGLPAVLVLNMWDVVGARGVTIDVEALAARLGVSVMPTVARKGVGIDALAAALGRLTTAVPA